MANKQFVGIDLGTTTSGLACLRADGSPEIVPNADGERLTPSVVYFDPYEDVKLVGSSARDGGDPSRTVFQIKRYMDDPTHIVEIDGAKWTPAEISALILSKLKRECSRIIGEFEEAVITVPANFNELARRSTIAAAAMAGIKVKRLVNEPTAAALYYAHRDQIIGKTLVYDLGGGTLDITVLEIDAQRNVKILTSEGARHLGGANFDEAILEIYGAEFKKTQGGELFTNDGQKRRILQLGEEAKKMLSKLQRVTETVSNEGGGIARVELTREIFEQAISRLLARTEMLVEQALNSANISISDLDHVVLVGGSTRIPAVRALLERITGMTPRSCGNVDECVALGAALFSANASNIQEVANTGYGTLALVDDPDTGGLVFQNCIVIEKDTPIPCECSQTYCTSEDDERIIEVEITQGEDTHPRYVDVIGRITLEVPPNRPAGCEVTVTYSYDENQRVQVHVLDHDTGKSEKVTIQYRGAGVIDQRAIERKGSYLKKLRIE